MEQMYLIEILIDKVTIFASEEDEKSGANKSLIIKVKFGPKVQFIIKEGQLALNEDHKDDIIICDEMGRRKWTRTIRVGKSYLFPSYPDTVLMILNKFPLDIEVWNDDENEVEIFVGIGTMHWETEFYRMLKDASDANVLHEPLTIKQLTTLYAECCCKQVGEIAFILRLSPLGDSIITEFQQLMKDPDAFVFRTNKAPSMFQCKRIEGDDPNFCMVGSLYETTTLEDPDVVNNAQKKIEICTELQSCGAGSKATGQHESDEKETKEKEYPIDKIKMGDITGPCGNTNCPLAHKVKNYIRALSSYKAEAAGKVQGNKDNITKNVCGACSCKDDRYHREDCPEKKNGGSNKAKCAGCGGITLSGETCEDRKKKMYGTGATPAGGSPTKTFSVTEVPSYKQAMYGRNYVVENMAPDYNNQFNSSRASTSTPGRGCCCRKPADSIWDQPAHSQQSQPAQSTAYCASSVPFSTPDNIQSKRSLGVNDQTVYNVQTAESSRKVAVYNCNEIPDDKDCKCDPPKPTPPCKTFDCNCIAEVGNVAARKAHKPFCPSYKHKSNCPVAMTNEEEEKKKVDDDEDETEPLPYGLPPIQLGPCPVMGRPCSVPDGFARMYKNAVLPTLPPSYDDAGKVCCSKEYERIKKAIKEYLKNEKENDFRCINKFNVDTERRCCDKEQRLLALTGKACCGSHKMAIQEKFKEEKK